MYRSHTCWELNSSHLNQSVTLSGWVNKIRNLGGMTFIDLRDRYGITQITYNPSQANFSLAEIKAEYVLRIQGTVKARPAEMINTAMHTGEIEIQPSKIEILSESQELPFSIDHENPVGEDLRLEYRYLDLRRKSLKESIIMRHKIYLETMNFFDQQGFLHLETPTFIKNTPEGSREFVVPARFDPGKFFVLPQSPQQHKQMLMVAGFDKYYQLARCYRDEDPRGDRQPEFTQVDFELSFVTQEEIIDLIQAYFLHLVKKYYPQRPLLAEPFPIFTWQEAMDQYGSDKPELRVDGLTFIDTTEWGKKSDFGLFQSSTCIKAMVIPKEMGRSEIEKKYEGFVKNKGSRALPWICFSKTEGVKGSIAKFFSPEALEELKNLTQAQTGDTVFFQADSWLNACNHLGMLRTEIIKELNLLEGKEEQLAFAFVVDMPLYELGDDDQLGATHHPFTTPKMEDIPFVLSLAQKIQSGKTISAEETQQLLQVKSDAYDIILNGFELGGGSIRIFDSELQHAIFSILWLSDQQIEERFWHLLKSFQYGVPPHGGCAFGLDRIVMLLQNKENIREVMIFPKNQKYRDLMLNAPSDIDADFLDELGLAIAEKKQ